MQRRYRWLVVITLGGLCLLPEWAGATETWRSRGGTEPGWNRADYDDSAWAEGSFGDLLARRAGKGDAWLRLRIPIPDAGLTLWLPRFQGSYEVFVDGEEVRGDPDGPASSFWRWTQRGQRIVLPAGELLAIHAWDDTPTGPRSVGAPALSVEGAPDVEAPLFGATFVFLLLLGLVGLLRSQPRIAFALVFLGVALWAPGLPFDMAGWTLVATTKESLLLAALAALLWSDKGWRGRYARGLAGAAGVLPFLVAWWGQDLAAGIALALGLPGLLLSLRTGWGSAPVVLPVDLVNFIREEAGDFCKMAAHRQVALSFVGRSGTRGRLDQERVATALKALIAHVLTYGEEQSAVRVRVRPTPYMAQVDVVCDQAPVGGGPGLTVPRRLLDEMGGELLAQVSEDDRVTYQMRFPWEHVSNEDAAA